jgi:hypothetical protein
MPNAEPTSVPLSDDEVLAAAHLLERDWSRPLLTVTPRQERDSAAAVVRGVRSLALRGLLVDDELDGYVAQVIAVATSAAPRAWVMTVDDKLQFRTDGMLVELYEDGDRVLARLTTVVGVNVFMPSSMDRVMDMVVGATWPPEGPESAPVALLVRRDGDADLGLLVDRNAVTSLLRDSDNAWTVGSEAVEAADAEQLVAELRRRLT